MVMTELMAGETTVQEAVMVTMKLTVGATITVAIAVIAVVHNKSSRGDGSENSDESSSRSSKSSKDSGWQGLRLVRTTEMATATVMATAAWQSQPRQTHQVCSASLS
jgi:hypothetical protein